MKTLRLTAVAALAILAIVAPSTPASPGVKTSKPPYLVPTAPGVVVDPILSTGDVVGGYQMSGIPDGLGAYTVRNGDDDDDDDGENEAFTVVMNHELGKTFPAMPPGVDARISRLEIDRDTRSVTDAEYLFTGQEGFERFCSSTLEVISGRPFYFTGEEAVDAGHDGSSIALDPDTGMWRETPHFGKFQHENVVPLKLKKWVFLTSEDDFRSGQPSYLYAYIADDFNRALRGTRGSLYVWKADNPAETGNATVTKGESVPGHFVPIPQSENTSSASLKAAAGARDAFRFDRLEDVAVRPGKKGRTYIAETGKPPTTARGRIYQFDIDSSDPTQATLRMILNGDGPDNDDIYNPDNMDASGEVLVIQEDRESAFRDPPFSGGYSRVLVYDFDSKTLRSVARVNTPPPLRPGTWESSGVIDARHVLGRNWWLLDVQAHSTTAPQPGPILTPNSSSGEDGQLLAIRIPKSHGGDD